MNKKGFTLVELLAVIVILALLALLTSTAVTKLVKDSKNDLSEIQMKSIKSAAESWGAENLSKLPDVGECKYLTLQDLKNSGLLDSNIIDPNTNEEISDNLYIKITTTTNSGKDIVSYEVNPESVSGCTDAMFLLGDVNKDGVLDKQDAIDLSYYLIRDVSIAKAAAGDMNEDGIISVADINLLSKKVGLATSLPGETGILGDVDGNGLIEENDAQSIMNEIYTVLNNCDITDDTDETNGEINLNDAVALSQFIQELQYK